MGAQNEAARRRPLSRAHVLRAGIKMADERGPEGLSMRALGRGLGVEAMSLYNHVANKDDLLDGMVDLVIAEIDVPRHNDEWKTALRRRALSARMTFARHPWALRLIHTRESSGPARLRSFEATIACLRRAGFSYRLTVYALSAIDAYVGGFGTQRLNIKMSDFPDDAAIAAAVANWLPSTEYPYLSALINEYVVPEGYDEEASFAFGLDLVLDGLEKHLAAAAQ